MQQTELISPNLHVILIHYPLAMLLAGTAIETFSFLWSRSSFRAAGRWMILIGALAMIPATFSGVYALQSIVGGDVDANWLDRKAASPVLAGRPEVWNMLRQHMLLQSIATSVAAGVVMIWLGSSDRLRRTLHLTLLMLLLATCGTMVYGAWFGGESVYRKGVAVQTSVAGKTDQTSTANASAADAPTRAEIMFPPLEQHTIFAGVAIALSVVSIGLSFRKLTHSAMEDPIVTAGPVANRMTPRTPPTSFEMSRTFNPDLEVEGNIFVPAGRFWMLACLVAIITTVLGLFVLGRRADLIQPIRQNPRQAGQMIWNQIKPDPPQKVNRLLVHAIAGSAMIALPIILALLARFAPRQRMVLGMLTLLLSLAVAAQVWDGILLLLDSNTGSVYRYNPPTS